MCFVKGLNLIPASISLTISFFVLFTVSKCSDRRLKIFGYLVAAFLLLYSPACFSAVYAVCAGGADTDVLKEVRTRPAKTTVLPAPVARSCAASRRNEFLIPGTQYLIPGT